MTGVLFQPQTPEALAQAVRHAEGLVFSPEEIVRNAERFSRTRFEREISGFVADRIAEWRSRTDGSSRQLVEAATTWN